MKVGHEYVSSTVPAHGLLPEVFLLVMQTARQLSSEARYLEVVKSGHEVDMGV